MIKCPECSTVISVRRKRLPLRSMESVGLSYKFRICLVATMDTFCRRCKADIPFELIQERIMDEVLISEGASSMSAMNPRRLNSSTGKKAANKRWNPPALE